MTIKSEIRNSFDKAAKHYEQEAKIQYEIGLRLFERLDYMRLDPAYILDIGCGTGAFSKMLVKKYPKAKIVSLDLSWDMLQKAQKKQSLWKKWPLLNADMLQLPFLDGVFDLVFANQALHWSLSWSAVLSEINRVMKAEACLLFSTLGPDTFKEIRQSWSTVDKHAHTNQFTDMHDIGDFLLAEYFLDPVMDMEMLTMHYSSLTKLLKSIKSQGVRNINQARNVTLTGKKAWSTFQQNYQALCTQEGKYPLSYEVLYGHAWKGNKQAQKDDSTQFISIDKIKRLQRESV